eukprot:6284979-Prorocentrum_lima.AAC.1
MSTPELEEVVGFIASFVDLNTSTYDCPKSEEAIDKLSKFVKKFGLFGVVNHVYTPRVQAVGGDATQLLLHR